MKTKESPESSQSRKDAFPETRWSLVAKSTGEGIDHQRALSELCERYWYPIYCFIRRSGKSPEDCEDIAQSFFEKILSRHSIDSADRTRGRFRTFLLTNLKGHMIDDHRRVTATKRGGKAQVISIDRNLAEERYNLEPSHALTPDIIFERRWAGTLLNTVMGELRDEYIESGNGELFQVLEPHISWNNADEPQQVAADKLRLGLPAVRMQVYHLRRRFGELLRAEIADTVTTAAEVEAELADLRKIFA